MKNLVNSNKSIAICGGGFDSAAGRAHISAMRIDGNYTIKAGVFSRDDKKNKSSANIYNLNNIHLAKDYSSLLDYAKEEKIDCLAIITPSFMHYDQCMEALNKSNQNVFCEKSVCTNINQAKILKNKCHQLGKNIYTFFNYTGYAMVREIREMIKQNTLGQLLHVECTMPQQTFSMNTLSEEIIQPQSWRLNDDEIPSVSLDLGVHVVNLIEFCTDRSITSVSGWTDSKGNFKDIIDYVMARGKLSDNCSFSLEYGKCMLGNANGLQLKIYGSKGAVEWVQEYPDRIKYSNNVGEKKIITMSNQDLMIASQARYMRFKAGHPTGFIEAFANYYQDLAEKNKEYIFDINYAYHNLNVLHHIHQSNLKKTNLDIS